MEDYPNNPNYKIIENIGQGDFVSSFKVLNKNNNDICVIKKIILKDSKSDEVKEIQNEIKILSSIDNDYIIKYYDSFLDNESLNIVMEYCDGLDLRKYINEHKESNKLIEKDLIYHITSDICKGLQEIHNKKLVHRDLKPCNLFLTGDLKIKIGNFGVDKRLYYINEFSKTNPDSMLYMPPEILYGGNYNDKVDIWSLGCIIHELCTLNNSFKSKSINEFLSKMIELKHEKINETFYGVDLQNLLNLLLNKEYKKRPNIEEIIRINNKYQNVINQIDELFQYDEAFQNYLLEKNMEKSIEQVSVTILSREKKYSAIKSYAGTFIAAIPLNIALTILTGGLSLLPSLAITFTANSTLGLIIGKIFDPKKKYEFINNNAIIYQTIQNKLVEVIKDKINEKI